MSAKWSFNPLLRKPVSPLLYYPRLLDRFEQNVPILGQAKAPGCMLMNGEKNPPQVFFQDPNHEVEMWGIWKKVRLVFLEVIGSAYRAAVGGPL